MPGLGEQLRGGGVAGRPFGELVEKLEFPSGQIKMEEQLLSQLESMLPRLSPAARREAELTNLPMINDHLQTFRYRRAHWKQRAEALNGHRSR